MLVGQSGLHCVSDVIYGNNGDQETMSDQGNTQETELGGTETRSQEGCQEFREWWGCV